MFHFAMPGDATLETLLQAATKEPLPEGPWNTAKMPGFLRADHTVRIGHGGHDFDSACEALRQWTHYAQDWIRVYPRPPKLEAGSTFVVAAKTYGMWSTSACRVYEVIEQSTPTKRFGFAYRTLAHHVEQGDARFVVEQRNDGDVMLEIRTISRLKHLLPRLLSPLGRRVQRIALAGAIKSIEAAVLKAARTEVAQA
jgi:uncharacterized protein (UPF0548 family)